MTVVVAAIPFDQAEFDRRHSGASSRLYPVPGPVSGSSSVSSSVSADHSYSSASRAQTPTSLGYGLSRAEKFNAAREAAERDREREAQGQSGGPGAYGGFAAAYNPPSRGATPLRRYGYAYWLNSLICESREYSDDVMRM